MWYFHGRYVIIEITGVRPEWMLNALRQHGVPALDAAPVSRTAMRLRLSARDFKKLHALSREMPFRVRILSRRGLPFRFLKLRHRAVLVFGSAALIFLFALLAPRILVISVTGCYSVPEKAVLRLLKNEGVRPFALRDSIEVIPVADRVRAADERIAWLGIDLDGVRCRVEIVEAVPQGARIDYSVPCDVIAKKAGVILSVTALSGEQAISRGERVAPGDVLIKGQVTDAEAEDQVFVHARGEALANVWYRAEAAAEATVTDLSDTGKTAYYRRVCIGGLRISETKSPFEKAELRLLPERTVFGTLLPLTVTEGRYHEQGERERTRTDAEREEAASAEAERRCYEKLPKDARIVSKTVTAEMSGGVTVAECTIVTLESIGITKEIAN